MKPTAFVLCMILLLAGVASAQLDSVWIRTYGGPENDGFRCAVPTTDGGFVAVGYTYSYGPDDVNVFAVKTDAGGDTLWMRTYGGGGRDYGYGVCETASGDYVIAGYTTSFGSGKEDVYIVKVNTGGDTVWTRTYGGPEPDEARALCATSDGHVVVAGRTESYGAGESDCYVLKIDAAGDTVWTGVFGGTESDWGQGVCELGDGTYGVSGTSGSNSGNMDIYALKLAADGSLSWENYYGDTGPVDPDWGMGAHAIADTEMVVAGYRAIEGFDPGEACFLRVGLDGGSLGYRRYKDPYYEYGNSICPIPESGYLICGATRNDSTMTNDLFLVKKVDDIGFVWADTLGGPQADWGSWIAPCAPGFYIITGHTASYGSGGFDGWLLYMREPSAGSPAEPTRVGKVLMPAPAPNPFSSLTSIRLEIPAVMPVALAVYDVSGRRVAVLEDGCRDSGVLTRTWDGRDENGRQVSPGIYIARASVGEHSMTRKIVLIQ